MLSLEESGLKGEAAAGLPGGVVRAVAPGSPTDRAGVRPGDRLLTLDGLRIVDEIDLKFRQDRELQSLTVGRGDNVVNLSIVKDRDEDLGLTFEDGLFDGIRECNNRCSFCFLKGLPAGLRRSLYFKDDDFRLSFLYGNFVTLTNLSQADWHRLIDQRLSPLYMSVHSTNLSLRRKLLGNPAAPDPMQQLRELASHGIAVHSQIVVTPGVNDGSSLVESIEDLASLAPSVLSIGVVPVGLTERGAFSQHIRPDLVARLEERGARPKPTTREQAIAVVDLVEPLQSKYRTTYGRDLVYLADEYYLRAGRSVPARSRYDGFPQFQNGIGMVRDLLEQWRNIRRRPPAFGRTVHLTAVCGELVAPVLAPIFEGLAHVVPGVRIDLVPVVNSFFGVSVTASGLLTSADVLAALRGRLIGAALVIPRAMLDSAGDRFLDDRRPADIEAALGVPVFAAGTLRELINVAQSVVA